MQKFLNQAFGHVQLGELLAQVKQFLHRLHALVASKDFRCLGADLRCEHAHPYLLYLRFGAPELNELLQIECALHHLAGDGAMHGHSVTTNALQNSGISGGFATLIVLRLQAVNGYHDVQFLDGSPLRGNLAERAGYDLDVNPTVLKQRKQTVDLHLLQ